MAKEKRNVKETIKLSVSPFKDYWNKSTYILLAVGLGILIIGYYLMAQGNWDSTSSLTISPIVLLIGYLILIPLSILFKIPTKLKKETNVSSKD